MRRRSFLTLSALGVLLFAASAASGQNVEPIDCQDGAVLAGEYQDVRVYGGSCTLDGATVYGSVFVSGGTLATTANGALILGSIQVNIGGDITLESVHVWDEVKLQHSGNLSVTGNSTLARISVTDSADVAIEAAASTGEVQLENSGHLTVSGSVASIISTGSAGIRLNDATVFPGGVTMSLSTGSLEICGSEIGGISGTLPDGSGGIYALESGDVLAVAEGSWTPSEIEGSVIVKKGTGHVRFIGATLNSDLIVTEQVGDVEVDGSGCDLLDPLCGTVSDVNVEKLTGNVTLRGVTTDSDTTVVENDGRLIIDSSTLGGDVRVRLSGMVWLTENSFSLEDVLIAKNDGPILLDRNCDARLTITESNSVMITNNNPTDAEAAGATCSSDFGFSDADVSKNSGGVLIENNTGEGLFCTDNAPAPAQGSEGNTITFSDGQCAGF